MKAAVLYELNSPLEIRDISLPNLKPGQVLVKLHYSGVCHSQLMEVKGRRGEDKFLPHLLGHEGSGTVIEVGQDVTKVKKGEKVILGWIKGLGADEPSTQYLYDSTIINSGAVSTFSEMTIVSENRCIALPEGIPLDLAVLFGCAVPTGAGIVINTIKPEKGARVAVFGIGGIGFSALMATKLYECAEVIAIDVSNEKLALAKSFGATKTINAKEQDPVKEILRLTDGKGVDYCVEASGLARTIEQSFESIKRGGLSVFATHPKQGDKICIDPFELICGKRLSGSWGGDSNPDRDIPEFAHLYREGRLPLEKLITKRYRLSEINKALDDLANQKVMRPLIEISPI